MTKNAGVTPAPGGGPSRSAPACGRLVSARQIALRLHGFARWLLPTTWSTRGSGSCYAVVMRFYGVSDGEVPRCTVFALSPTDVTP